MRFTLYTGLSALALAAGLVSPAAAQTRPTLAIMPTQYFSADAESARNVTEGLAREFTRQGYSLVSMDRSRAAFSSMGLMHSRHYADRVALNFGRSLGADLVAYPRLLGVGIPVAGSVIEADRGLLLEPAAVLHLRVLNTRTGEAIYFRQIAHEFRAEPPAVAEFRLPEPVAAAAAQEVTGLYFQRVAGSREERRN